MEYTPSSHLYNHSIVGAVLQFLFDATGAAAAATTTAALRTTATCATAATTTAAALGFLLRLRLNRDMDSDATFKHNFN
jgi:hypothetical protein